MSGPLVTPEDALYILADAAGVRNPHPDRDNRGLCPAHGDQHNPALVFKLGDTGNLVLYCHAQHCTVDKIAAAVGLSTASFFADRGGHFTEPVVVEWVHRPILDLLKMVPFDYDHDTMVECVMRTLDLDLIYAERTLGDMTKTELLALGSIWLEPGYRHDTHGDWWDVYHVWLQKIHALDRETKVDPHAQTSAVPIGEM